ncbi:hypothetical protein J8273_7288 [Carpediemonas membranifera]|uniref:Uncharacterized protein n=1 Tax=Carpediemonas membranifera TaxID=201153 RepID=A0A8J6DXU5_9EUKA|nr:hypothetical protein J8273_7288 [Carpediemonas membranifera]|eukprot:KAG9391014.1 hypothetical protein J8273_7288 [Carpediemonas membranifera]
MSKEEVQYKDIAEQSAHEGSHRPCSRALCPRIVPDRLDSSCGVPVPDMETSSSTFTVLNQQYSLDIVMLSKPPSPTVQIVCVPVGSQGIHGLSVAMKHPGASSVANTMLIPNDSSELNSNVSQRLSARFGGMFLVSLAVAKSDDPADVAEGAVEMECIKAVRKTLG